MTPAQSTQTEIFEQIQKLKQQKNAVLLAHNYQLPEVQDVADFVWRLVRAFAGRSQDPA